MQRHGLEPGRVLTVSFVESCRLGSVQLPTRSGRDRVFDRVVDGSEELWTLLKLVQKHGLEHGLVFTVWFDEL